MSQALVYYCDSGTIWLERFVGIFGEGFVTTESESTHSGFPLQTLSHAGVFALRAIQLWIHFDVMGSRLVVIIPIRRHTDLFVLEVRLSSCRVMD